MLQLLTDEQDRVWLNYIIEEFVRIENANFPIEVKGLNPIYKKSEGIATIIYSRDPQKKEVCIPNRSAQTTLVPLHFISEKLYVFENTIIASEFSLSYDLLWNAFCFLSRKEEYEQQLLGKNINSYSYLHPRSDVSTFDIPIVNILFGELKSLILENYPNLNFGPSKAIKVELSHDLDYIKKTWPLRIKQTAFNLFKTIKSVGKPKETIHHWKRCFQFFFSNPSYWCFDYWEEIETRHGYSSTFYIYAKADKGGFKKWLMDPSYNVTTNMQLQKRLKVLAKNGFNIGIHGSFNSAESEGDLKNEKEVLEKALDLKISKGRQHWLRYNESITPEIHEQLLEEDSTLGWNDRSGFRAGCCSKYRLFSHQKNRVMSLWVIPQIIMDSHLFDYAVNEQQKMYERGVKLLEGLKEYGNVNVSISWHPRTASSDYNWHFAYEKYLQIIDRL